MRLKKIGANCNEVIAGDGRAFLFSYGTPVAVRVDGHGYFATSQFWSATTSRHTRRWVQDGILGIEGLVPPVKLVEQCEISEMAEGMVP